ncbi:MAG: DNA-formamidopyrimidine glycosylase family protein [Gemmatimonadota bacterium]
MPELPDVEVFRQYVDATSLHHDIAAVHLHGSHLVDGVTPRTLRRHLNGHALASTRRHGKYLFLKISKDPDWLLLHFGMTGLLKYYRVGDEPAYTKLRLDFANGYSLAYINKRKLGRIGLVRDLDQFIEAQSLGPDPWAEEFDLEVFRSILEGRRGTIKGLLMNQSAMAGLGNEYADEVLFQAGIHPQTPVDQLDEDTVRKLFDTMERVIRQAINARADVKRMPLTWLLPHRQREAPCPRCGGTVRRTEVSGRATYFCTRHQPEPD